MVKSKLVMGLVGVASLGVAMAAAYYVGRAHERAECAQERAVALSDALSLQRSTYERRAELAETRADEERARRREAEQAARARREELDDYLDTNEARASAVCLSPDELELFNQGRAG